MDPEESVLRGREGDSGSGARGVFRPEQAMRERSGDVARDPFLPPAPRSANTQVQARDDGTVGACPQK